MPVSLLHHGLEKVIYSELRTCLEDIFPLSVGTAAYENWTSYPNTRRAWLPPKSKPCLANYMRTLWSHRSRRKSATGRGTMRRRAFQLLGTDAASTIKMQSFGFLVFRGHTVQEALAVGTREFERASLRPLSAER